MAAFSELIIILSIALLAVIVTIFIFAASLLREAIPQALEKQREIAGEHNKEFEVTIADMQKALDAARGTGGFGELEKKFHEYGRKRKQFEKASKRIEKKYQLLKTRGGVVYPAAVLLLALALAGSVQLVTALVWQGVLFGLSILAVGWVCYRIYEIALVVQSIATTPEDAVDKTREAFEKALEIHEERKRPKLRIEFTDPKHPFRFKPSSERVMQFVLDVEQGDVGRSAELFFYVPEGFEFPGQKTWRRRADYSDFPNAITTMLELGDLKSSIYYTKSLTIKAPSKADVYHCAYSLHCEGFTTGLKEFDIEVTE